MYTKKVYGVITQDIRICIDSLMNGNIGSFSRTSFEKCSVVTNNRSIIQQRAERYNNAVGNILIGYNILNFAIKVHWHRAIQYNTTQHNTTQCNTMQCNTIQNNTRLYKTML